MNKEILAALTRIAETLDGLRQDQKVFAERLLLAVQAGLGAVEHAVSMTHGDLDQAADSLFELQMYLTPGGDPREPMPS
jgi:hypothetical protein